MLETIAHRGFASLRPENTMEAFEHAVALGFRVLEMDVMISSDGVPVCIHDTTVDRTTDGTGTVASKTLAQLQALDAGSHFNPIYSAARIPTLEEVVQFAAANDCYIYPEIKSYRTQADIQLMLDVVEDNGMEDRSFFQSLTFSDLSYARARNAAVGLGFVTASNPTTAAANLLTLGGRTLIIMEHSLLLGTPAWVGAVKDQGVDVAAYTIISGQEAIEISLLALGVRRIMYDQSITSAVTVKFDTLGAFNTWHAQVNTELSYPDTEEKTNGYTDATLNGGDGKYWVPVRTGAALHWRDAFPQ